MGEQRNTEAVLRGGSAAASTYDERREAFERFHRANPHVYRQISELALEMARLGKRVGMRLLIEKLRWDLRVQTEREEDEPKINDHFAPFFSRKLMAECPELAGYFETRDRESNDNDFHAAEGQREPEAANAPLGKQKAGSADGEIGPGGGPGDQPPLFPDLFGGSR